jgi:hypothetical protein
VDGDPTHTSDVGMRIDQGLGGGPPRKNVIPLFPEGKRGLGGEGEF